MIYFLLIIFGLVLGSFVNALVYRLNARKSFLFARSACPHCGHKLAVRDLVPLLSFLFLRGRCRYCREKISRQYPLVEFAAVALLVLTYRVYSPDIFAVFGYAVLSLFLLVIFIYDYKYYLIPDSVTLPAIIFAFGFNFWRGFGVGNLFLGMAVGGGFFLLQYVISRGKWIGGGDIRLVAVNGIAIAGL
ncbi:MAG: prepilin peptidase, partial [Patescibacteria group bacterium]